jgi:hypothetical protein
MDVIRHHAEGEQAHAIAAEGLGQDPLEGGVVPVVLEDGMARRGPVPDMGDDPAFGDPRGSAQEGSVRREAARVNRQAMRSRNEGPPPAPRRPAAHLHAGKQSLAFQAPFL